MNADAPTVAGPVAPGPGQPGFKESRILRDFRRAAPPAQGGENRRIPNVPLQSGGNRIDRNPIPRREINGLIEANKPLPNPDGTGPQTNADLRYAGAKNLSRNEQGIVHNFNWPTQMIGSVVGLSNVTEAHATFVNANPRIKNPKNLPLSHHNTNGTTADKIALNDFLKDGNLNGADRTILTKEFGLMADVSGRSVSRWVQPDNGVFPPPQAMDYVQYVRQNPITANHTPPPIAAGTPPDMSPSQPGYPPTPKGYIHDPYPVPRLNAGPVREEDAAGPDAGALPPSPQPLSAHPGNSPATESDYYGATPRTGAFNTPVASPQAPSPQLDIAGADSPGAPSQPPPTSSLHRVLGPGEYVGEGHSLLAQYAPRPREEDQ